MDKQKEEYMSAEELRNRLYHSLRDRGLVNNMKSQLRKNLVSELKRSVHDGDLKLEDLGGPDEGKEGTLLLRACNSLIANHLRRCKYDYAYSVFLPECGVDQAKIFSASDLLDLLRVSPQSRLYRKMTSKGSDASKKGFLWQLLSELCALHSQPTQSYGTQTDLIRVNTVTSLDEKLHTLDEMFSSRRDEQYRTGSLAIEDRLMGFQKQLEERCRTELKLEVARVKDDEVTRIRLEEKEKSRRELDQLRRELERQYQSKFEGLVNRERNSTERIQREQELQEKEIYNQRQSILEEIEAVRQRETQIRRETEVFNREKNLEAERLKAKEQMIRRREMEVQRMEVEFEQRLSNQMTQFKVEHQAKYLERAQNLEVREGTHRENEKRSAEEKEKLESLKDELRDKTARVNELETLLQEARHKEVSATKHNDFLNAKLRDMADYATLKEQNITYKSELESVRSRMTEIMQLNERERVRQENMIRELRPAPAVYMDETRSNLRTEQAVAESRRYEVERKFQEETGRSRDLLRQFEEQTIHMKEMNQELVDVKQQLVLTQQALKNEVYRKPHGPDTSKLVSFNVSSRSARDANVDSDGSDLDIGRDSLRGSSKKRSSRGPGHKFATDDVYNDVDLDRFTGAKRISTDFEDESMSSNHSAEIIAETKYRLKSLEKEARNLEKAYLDFHHQLTNPSAQPLPDSSHRSLRKSGSQHRESSGRSHPVASPTASPIARPLSSTPYQKQQQRSQAEDSDDSLHELKKSSQTKERAEPVPRFDLSDMSDEEQTSRLGAERLEKPRPITVDDLEARPGSPEIVVVAGEGASSEGVSPSTQESRERLQEEPIRKQDSVEEKPTSVPHGTRLPPLSLDAAWKTPAVGLDQAWKGQTEKVSKEESSGDEDWEEQRRRKEEERRRQKQEAWEREQRELQQLQERQSDSTTGTTDTRAEAEKESKKEEIDPVMQQYMAMVQQQKATEQPEQQQADATPSHTENDISMTDEVKSEGAGSGDEFDDW